MAGILSFKEGVERGATLQTGFGKSYWAAPTTCGWKSQLVTISCMCTYLHGAISFARPSTRVVPTDTEMMERDWGGGTLCWICPTCGSHPGQHFTQSCPIESPSFSPGAYCNYLRRHLWQHGNCTQKTLGWYYESPRILSIEVCAWLTLVLSSSIAEGCVCVWAEFAQPSFWQSVTAVTSHFCASYCAALCKIQQIKNLAYSSSTLFSLHCSELHPRIYHAYPHYT